MIRNPLERKLMAHRNSLLARPSPEWRGGGQRRLGLPWISRRRRQADDQALPSGVQEEEGHGGVPGVDRLGRCAASCDVVRPRGRRRDLDRLVYAAIKLLTSPAGPTGSRSWERSHTTNPAPERHNDRDRRTSACEDRRHGLFAGQVVSRYPLIAPHASERLTDGRHLPRCRR